MSKATAVIKRKRKWEVALGKAWDYRAIGKTVKWYVAEVAAIVLGAWERNYKEVDEHVVWEHMKSKCFQYDQITKIKKEHIM